MSANARQEAIRKIAEQAPVAPAIDYVKKPVTQLYGENVFTLNE
jgi:hypothetical protein